MARKHTRTPTVTAVPSACPACGSLRARVLRTDTMPDTPLYHQGVLYPSRKRQLVKCSTCGQNRYVNTPLEAPGVAPSEETV